MASGSAKLGSHGTFSAPQGNLGEHFSELTVSTMSKRTLRVATRSSALALWQAEFIKAELERLHDNVIVELVKIKTQGDKILDVPLAKIGGKGLFTRELEIALMDGAIDLAVHSMKDVPTLGEPALEISAVLRRADVRDAFISLTAKTLMDLPQGATVGTASIRRQAQAAAVRPDLKFSLIRGNVGTRLSKLEAGECAATFLASAGLTRLGMKHVITDLIPTAQMLPAPAQGAIGIEIQKARTDVAARLAPLNHQNTLIAITAERAFQRALDGSCRTPIAALAQISGKDLHFRGQVFSQKPKQSGTNVYGRETNIALGDEPLKTAYATGAALGAEILKEAGGAFVWDDI